MSTAVCKSLSDTVGYSLLWREGEITTELEATCPRWPSECTHTSEKSNYATVCDGTSDVCDCVFIISILSSLRLTLMTTILHWKWHASVIVWNNARRRGRKSFFRWFLFRLPIRDEFSEHTHLIHYILNSFHCCSMQDLCLFEVSHDDFPQTSLRSYSSAT